MLADQEVDEDDDTPDRDLQAQVAVREVRALSIIQTPQGFDGHTDLGDDVTPLEALDYHAIRNNDDTEGVLADASPTITPPHPAMDLHPPGTGPPPPPSPP